MSTRHYFVLQCDVRRDHRCHRLTTPPKERRWRAVRDAIADGWHHTSDGDICPACQEERPEQPPCTGDPCTCRNGIGCINVPMDRW